MLSVQQLLDHKPKAIYSIGPDEPVLAAIKKMAEHHIGALLVMSGDRLVGIVSERDYARKVVLLGRSSEETLVEAIMTTKVISVTAEAGRARLHAAHDRHAHPSPAGGVRAIAWWACSPSATWCARSSKSRNAPSPISRATSAAEMGHVPIS